MKRDRSILQADKMKVQVNVVLIKLSLGLINHAPTHLYTLYNQGDDPLTW